MINLVDDERRRSGMDHYDLPLDEDDELEESDKTQLLPRIQVPKALKAAICKPALPQSRFCACDNLDAKLRLR